MYSKGRRGRKGNLEKVTMRRLPDFDHSPFQLFEDLKDRIIAAFRNHVGLYKDAIGMWCGDARELYYSTLLARDLLRRESPDTASASGVLAAASSYCGRVASELRALGPAGIELEQELLRIFQVCHDELSARIPKPAVPHPAMLPERVVRVSDEEYKLPCSVCGLSAVRFYRAGPEEKILEGLICAGITRSFGLNPEYEKRVLEWLAAGDLGSIHKFLEKDLDVDGGLDAYCPECDRVYCYFHYNVQREWDEGFYDCAHGTCPQGHRRLVDD